MKKIALILPYYKNPGMLQVQYDAIASYTDEIKDNMVLIVVDDGTPHEIEALKVARPSTLPEVQIYKVTEDRPWNQHGARNLGAWVARAEWLFLTDIDHVIPTETMQSLMGLIGRKHVYKFARVDAPDMRPTLDRHGNMKPHPNTYYMTRDLYWKIGGYNEYFCGYYGTDSFFRERIQQHARIVQLDENIIRVSREVIPDASTVDLPRKQGRDRGWRKKLVDRYNKSKHAGKILTITFPWVQQL